MKAEIQSLDFTSLLTRTVNVEFINNDLYQTSTDI